MSLNKQSEICQFVSGLASTINGSYTFNNNSMFSAFANSGYKDYLWRYVYREAQWLDGYVSDFHGPGSGIVSTRLCPAIMMGFARQIVGTSLSFKSANYAPDSKALDFVSHKWYPKSGLQNALRSLELYALALGTALIKINKTNGGEYWIEPCRLDQCYFSTDFRGAVREATFLIRSYVDTKDNADNFFLVERRFFQDGYKDDMITLNGEATPIRIKYSKPMVEFQVHRYHGMVSTNAMPAAANLRSGMGYSELPAWLQRKLASDYSAVRVNEPMPLPFSSALPLGVDILRNDGQDPTVPTLGFGFSEIKSIEPELIGYDFSFTKYLQDIYNGAGKIGLPKSLSMQRLNPNASQTDTFSGLDFSRYEFLDGQDPSKSSPTATQFQLRGLEWQGILDDFLRKIATKMGMAPKTLSSYLGPSNQQKTATEAHSDDDASIAVIEMKRSMLKPVVDRIIEEILNQNGMGANVECKFGSPALMDQDRLLDRISKEYESHFITLEEAIRELNPDDDEEQIKARVAAVKGEKDSESALNPFNPIQTPESQTTNGQPLTPMLPKTDEDGIIWEDNEDAD
jgi:hypothetical protein